MATSTRNDWLLERIAERLGVPKADAPAAFSPDPLGLLRGLVDLLADPATAKKNVADLAKANDATAAARAEQKKAADDRKAADAEIAAKRSKHDETIANELAAHTVEMDKRTRAVESREQAVAAREREADQWLAELKADRTKIDKKLSAIKAAAA